MKIWWGAILVVIVGLWSVWPMVKNPAQVPDFGSDGVLLTWIFNQDSLFEGNIFYPYQRVLAYSDRQLLTHFATRLPVMLAQDPAVAFGSAMVFGQVLTLLIVYVFWAQVTKNPGGALVATVLFGLAQTRFEYQVHLQMFSMQYWLLGLLLVFNYIKKRRWQYLCIGGLFLGGQFWESLLPIYFSALVLSVWWVSFKLRLNRQIILAVCLSFLVMFPMAKSYYQVSRQFGVTRSIRESAHNALSVDDLWKKAANPAVYVVGLTVLLLSFRSSRPGHRWLWFVLGIAAVMSLGPVLKWHDQTVKILEVPIPLPYAVLHYTIPGFEALRTPSRWWLLAIWSASGLIASRLNPRLRWWQGALLVGIAIIGGTRLTQVRALPSPWEYPLVYRWLTGQPGKTVLELPVYTWPEERMETNRMLYSLLHRKWLVNGYSGFTPPTVFTITSTSYPEVDYIVSHLDEGGGTMNREILYQDETTVVYSGR